MGLNCICPMLALPKPISDLIQIICRFRLIVLVILSYFGLIQTLPQIDPFLDHGYFVAAADLPPNAQVTPSVILKSKLPVVEFANVFAKCKKKCAVHEPKCMVCLGWLEAKDEVRELGNCLHGFHKECIDGWVDVGHVRCPLCRSELLPAEKRRGLMGGRVFWKN